MAIGLRLLSYSLIFLAYCFFMEHQLPDGFGWADYHAYRIFNAVEYLRVNGYFSTLGFSIWSSCRDCDLQASAWEGKVYLSGSALTLWPYIFLNHFFGNEVLFSVGPSLDKAIIFLTGVLFVELFLENAKDCLSIFRSNLTTCWIGCIVAILFFTSVWSYQMYRAMWHEIWFVFFFVIGICLLLQGRNKTAIFFVSLAGFMHPTYGLIFGFVNVVFAYLARLFKEVTIYKSFIPKSLHAPRSLIVLSGFAALPALVFVLLRYIYQLLNHHGWVGSTLVSRIGIAGEDINNGGILGALQFLGGARITACLSSLRAPLGEIDLISKITAFNCTLTILGMALFSVLSLFGIFWFFRENEKSRPMLFPMIMILLVSTSVLQQSFSVHLLGHSYIFAVLFACGVGALVLKLSKRIGSQSISILVISPVIIALVILSLRVSMLAGIPG